MDVDWLTAVGCRQTDWLVERANGGSWLIGWSADEAMFQKSTAASTAVWSTDDVCLFQKSTGMTDWSTDDVVLKEDSYDCLINWWCHVLKDRRLSDQLVMSCFKRAQVWLSDQLMMSCFKRAQVWLSDQLMMSCFKRAQLWLINWWCLLVSEEHSFDWLINWWCGVTEEHMYDSDQLIMSYFRGAQLWPWSTDDVVLQSSTSMTDQLIMSCFRRAQQSLADQLMMLHFRGEQLWLADQLMMWCYIGAHLWLISWLCHVSEEHSCDWSTDDVVLQRSTCMTDHLIMSGFRGAQLWLSDQLMMWCDIYDWSTDDVMFQKSTAMTDQLMMWSYRGAHLWLINWWCGVSEEHSYDNLSSPTSPGFEDSASAGDAVPMSMDPEERERQIREWSEELEKVCSGWMDRVGFGICRHWFWVDGQGGVWHFRALVLGGRVHDHCFL